MRKNLKEARYRLGLSAKDMAAKLFVTRRYYLSIEQGTRTGDYTIWDALEDMTGTHQRILRENTSGKEEKNERSRSNTGKTPERTA